TSLVLTLADGSTRTVAVPAIADGAEAGAATTVTVPVEPFTTTAMEVTIGEVRPVVTREYFSGNDHQMPVAIAELGLPVTVGPLPADVPPTCHSGILSIDGVDVQVQLSGTVADAEERLPQGVTPCTGSAVPLGAGEHRLACTPGLDTGIDLDRVQLGSPAGAGPIDALADEGAGAVATVEATAPDPSVPTLTVEETGEDSYRVQVEDATDPFWLALGQSLSPGWTADVEGVPSLADAVLVYGFANGWS